MSSSRDVKPSETSERTRDTRTLIVTVPLGETSLTLGLIADRVADVATIVRNVVGNPPDIGVSWDSDFIGGIERHGDGFVSLRDQRRRRSTDVITSTGCFVI